MNNFVNKILSGDAEILAGGSIISFDNKPIKFEFASPSNPLKLILDFKKDATGKVYGNPVVINSQEIKLELFNFHNNLGSGLISPVQIGNLDGKKLYFSFRSYSLENSEQITLHYTFYKYGEA